MKYNDMILIKGWVDSNTLYVFIIDFINNSSHKLKLPLQTHKPSGTTHVVALTLAPISAFSVETKTLFDNRTLIAYIFVYKGLALNKSAHQV